MKAKYLILLFSLLLTILLAVFFNRTESSNGYEIQDAFQFKILPGTTAWQALNDNQEMLDVCQIPMETVMKMSTKALVETCLNYPMLSIYEHAYPRIDTGFDIVYENFNGIKELVTRKDASTILLEFYRNAKVLTPQEENNGDLDVVHHAEFLMAQDCFYEKFTDQERKELNKLVDEKTKEWERLYGENDNLLAPMILTRSKDVSLADFYQSIGL